MARLSLQALKAKGRHEAGGSTGTRFRVSSCLEPMSRTSPRVVRRVYMTDTESDDKSKHEEMGSEGYGGIECGRYLYLGPQVLLRDCGPDLIVSAETPSDRVGVVTGDCSSWIRSAWDNMLLKKIRGDDIRLLMFSSLALPSIPVPRRRIESGESL